MIGRATSDLHLTQRSAPWVFAALDEIRDDAEKRGGVTVLVGDILDQPSMVHMPTFNELRRRLHDWPGEVYVIAGNHDQYRGQSNALVALEGEGVTVISEITSTEFGLMVPYYPPDQFWDVLAGHPSASVWWTHQGWRGSYLNNMIKDKDGLCSSRVEADLVVTGHYHMPQNIGPIIYCGSPYQTTFAEEGQVKGWLRFDDDDLLPTRIAYERVGAPRHWTIRWVLADGQPEAPAGYREGDKLRIVTDSTRSDVKAASRQIKKAGLTGVPVIAQADRAERRVISGEAGPVEATHQYINRVFGPDARQPDPETLSEWATEVELWD